MTKRTRILILATALSVAALPVESLAATFNTRIVSGRSIIGEERGYSFRLNFNNLTSASNKIFHQDVAEAAILLSADFGEEGDIKIVQGDKSVLEQLGFEDIKTVELDEQQYSTDAKDIVVFSMGRKVLWRLGKKYVVYAIAIRGTLQLREWESNFDVGSLDENYERQTGEHPDWTHENHHKGFDVSANRVIKALDNYIDGFSLADLNAVRTILITGHSRGAAVANLIGKEYEDRYKKTYMAVKPYTYTFGTPTVSLESKKVLSSYKTIFNVVNDDDLVPCVPLEDWGFARYGKDLHVSVEQSRKLKRLWVSDNMSEMLMSYGEAYSEKMMSYSSIPLEAIKKPELKKADKSYKFADSEELINLIKLLFIGSTDDHESDRNFLYECRDIIWVPNDLPEDYSPYYEDAQYDEDSTEEEKAEFDRIAKELDCKRVKIAPFFMFVGLDRITTAILTDSNQEHAESLKEISASLNKRWEIGKGNKNRAVIRDILERAATVSDDIKLLAYASLLQGERMVDERDKVSAIIDFILHNDTDALMYAHMPTTYYFIINYL